MHAKALAFTIAGTIAGFISPIVVQTDRAAGFSYPISVAGSIFLILEMNRSFEGMMKISSGPFRYTLSHLGQ